MRGLARPSIHNAQGDPLSKTKRATPMPEACAIQLARLFGSESKEARQQMRTPNQWKRTLRRVLHELDRYVTANVDTDALHQMILASGLYAADQALREEDFWSGYVEGITRFALALLGDYPDHHRRKRGGKSAGHYRLDRCRSLRYIQNHDQRLATLIAAGNFGLPGLTVSTRDALAEFRDEVGYRVGYREFLKWYRKRYPQDYAAVF